MTLNQCMNDDKTIQSVFETKNPANPHLRAVLIISIIILNSPLSRSCKTPATDHWSINTYSDFTVADRARNHANTFAEV